MKKIYLLLFLATLPLNLFCQQDNVIVLDSTYSYYWDSDTNDWIAEQRYIYAYDDNGNQTEKTTYDWNSETNNWKYADLLFYSRANPL